MLINHEQLKDFLPHRGVNLFLDGVELADDKQSAVGHVAVPEGDQRQLLSRELAGQRCWFEPFLAEFFALSGIPMISDRGEPGAIAVFSMISKWIARHR